MHDIVCPHCGKAFKIDEAGYADILKQVRDADFRTPLGMRGHDLLDFGHDGMIHLRVEENPRGILEKALGPNGD